MLYFGPKLTIGLRNDKICKFCHSSTHNKSLSIVIKMHKNMSSDAEIPFVHMYLPIFNFVYVVIYVRLYRIYGLRNLRFYGNFYGFDQNRKNLLRPVKKYSVNANPSLFITYERLFVGNSVINIFY